MLTHTRDAFRGQSRSPNIVPFDMLGMICSIVTLSLKRTVFEIFDFEKISGPWNPGQRSFKVIRTHTDRSATYDFLLTFDSNHGPIPHRFRDKRQFQSKIQNCSYPFLLPRWWGSPWNWVSTHEGQKTKVMGLQGRTRSLTIIFSRVDTVHQRDGRTDGRTADDSKDRAYAQRRAVKNQLVVEYRIS